jgi:hypothetical protein
MLAYAERLIRQLWRHVEDGYLHSGYIYVQWKHVCIRAKRGNIYDYPFGRRELAFLNVMINGISWQRLQPHIHSPWLKPRLLISAKFSLQLQFTLLAPLFLWKAVITSSLSQILSTSQNNIPTFNVLQQGSPASILSSTYIQSLSPPSIHHVRQQHRQ